MIRVLLPKVHRVRFKLASGQMAEYHYAWRGGPRFWKTGDDCEVGSAEYLRRFEAAGRAPEGQGGPTFQSVLNAYQSSADWRRLGERTRRDYALWIGRIETKFGKAPREAFNRPGIRPVAIAWRDQWSGKQALYSWTVLRRVVSWAYEAGLLREHHLRGGGKVYDSDRSDVIWTPAEVDAVRTVASKPVADALTAAVETMLRPADLVALTRAQVLPTPGGQRIVARTAKKKRMASIPVTPAMADVIARAPADGPILRQANGRPWTASYLSQSVKAAARVAKVREELRLNDARGTGCTRLLLAGASLKDIALIMGWSLRHAAAVIERYAYLEAARADDVLRLIEAQTVKGAVK